MDPTQYCKTHYAAVPLFPPPLLTPIRVVGFEEVNFHEFYSFKVMNIATIQEGLGAAVFLS
jgi:hypothetical protein